MSRWARKPLGRRAALIALGDTIARKALSPSLGRERLKILGRPVSFMNAPLQASTWSFRRPFGKLSISSSSARCHGPASSQTLPPCTCAANGTALTSFEPVTRSA
jgi:hypothetical protein